MSKKKKFRYIKNCKLNLTPLDLCGTMSNAPVTHKLLDFVEEVMKLDFDETPNYNKLRFLLTRALLDVGRVPNREYDWISDKLSSV